MCCASAAVKPLTSGIATSGGPLDTNSVTVAPREVIAPAAGSCRITRSSGTVSLASVRTSGRNPAPTSDCCACIELSLTKLVTAMSLRGPSARAPRYPTTPATINISAKNGIQRRSNAGGIGSSNAATPLLAGRSGEADGRGGGAGGGLTARKPEVGASPLTRPAVPRLTAGCSRASRSARPSSVAEAKRSSGFFCSKRRDDRRQRRADAVAHRVERGRGFRDVFERDRDRRLAVERQSPGHHLVKHDAQRIEIGTRVEFAPLRLFRRDVRDAAHHHPGLRDADGVLRDRARDAEIAEFDDVVAGYEDVGGLDVAVQQALTVRECEPGRDLGGVIDRDGFRDAPLAAQHRRQRFTLDQFHDDEVRIAFVTEIVDVDDVGMREPGGGLRFIRKALDEIVVGRKLVAQHLDRNATAQQQVGAAVHDRHPAGTQAGIDAVAAVEDVFEFQRTLCSRSSKGDP